MKNNAGRQFSGKYIIVFFFIVVVLLFILRQFLQQSNNAISLNYPAHFSAPQDTTAVTVYGASLGKQLFHDPILSYNKQVSCASCHQQKGGYSDAGNPKSIGDRGVPTLRNSPALVNLSWKKQFFADGRVSSLTGTILNAVQDTLELNSDMGLILKRLNADPAYRSRFEKVYHSADITQAHFLDALTQYLRTLNAWDAKYDRVMLHKEQFTADENKGYLLFQQYCASCHIPPLFHTEQAFAHTVTSAPDNKAYFSPSLRNIMLSAPYLQDGSVPTLEKLLLLHPASGMLKDKKGLSTSEIQEVIAFLKTLSDNQLQSY
ncbi:cytochrome-c peroxidase [Sphingobacterium sp. Mn56C]|uniref:cytochrome-c peroxidase n=1 Tax=Sphingobacterium sp. Mn56C TaxID=3395261 RepID=UPI003BD85044